LSPTKFGGCVLVLRALPYGADSRAERWGQIYAPRKVLWGGWGAEQLVNTPTNILKHRPKTGSWGFLFGYPLFMIACFFFAFRRLQAGDTVVCIDLETAIPGWAAARLRGAQVHFDIADPFDLAKPVPLKPLFRWVEKCVAAASDVVTVPHSLRRNLYGAELLNARIVENVPELPRRQTKRELLKDCDGVSLMTFGYFGTLETHRGLEDLVKLVKINSSTRLKIGGRGPLTAWIIQAADLCERIEFFGSYTVSDLPSLVAEVDVYCSLYYKSKPLHQYAAPNKFFEHMALGVPVLMSSGTPYANDVRANGTGWVVDDGVVALQGWYEMYKLDAGAFELAANQAEATWEKHYKNWLSEQRHIFSSQPANHEFR
jgi:glycosyltransferase involved in cell wall biosynthesis